MQRPPTAVAGCWMRGFAAVLCASRLLADRGIPGYAVPRRGIMVRDLLSPHRRVRPRVGAVSKALEERRVTQ